MGTHPLSLPVKGTRVQLSRDVERFPDFKAPAGALGTVDDGGPMQAGEVFSVRMDVGIPGAAAWDNCIWWVIGDDDPLQDLTILPPAPATASATQNAGGA